MKITKETCEKCKKECEALWLILAERKDGTSKEQWICEECGKKHIKDFKSLLEKTQKFESEEK